MPRLFGHLLAAQGRFTDFEVETDARNFMIEGAIAVDHRRASHDLQPLADYVAEAQRRFDSR